MSSQAPRGRQSGGTGRSGGGRALMLFGVLLAILSGVLVIFVVSQATSNQGSTVQLVVATEHIPSGTVLTVGNIQADFQVKSYPTSLKPTNAYVFTSQDALQVTLNQTVAAIDIYPGDVLLNPDARFQPVGSVATGSLTASNPGALHTGEELFPLSYSDPTSGVRGFVVAGDHVDVLVTECGVPFSSSNNQCVTQTTFQNVFVYATFNGFIIVVMKQQDAQALKLLSSTGNVSLAIRKPGDTATNSTTAVSPQSLATEFHF